MTTHRTDALIARSHEIGLFADVPHFSCSHYAKCPSTTYGQSAFQFDDFGPQHAALRFIFRGNGEVLFSGCPNQWSTYQHKDIFTGHSDAATDDLFNFSMDSIPVIKETLRLYFESQPHKDYSELLDLWSHVRPTLTDKPVEAHFSSPWWKFW